jgi:conjugal transfer pilus assembly protein TraB
MSTDKAEKYRVSGLFKRFRKHFFIVGAIVVVIVLILSFMGNNKISAKKTKLKASETFTAAKPLAVSQADVVAQRIADFKDNQDSVNQQNSIRIAVLESEIQQSKQEKAQAESQAQALNAKLATLNSPSKKNSSAVAVTAKPQMAVFEDDINSDAGDSAEDPSLTAKSSLQNKVGLSSVKTSKEDPEKVVTTYIPSNTYVPGVLIDAMAANTGGSASADPTPGLVRLTSLASLPNEFSSRLKSCRVGVSGWGDLSSERIKMRSTTLSCVLKNGKAIDIPVEGFIAGEDSKSGLRGLVVTHSGTIAAKATLAGFIQGIGTIGQAMGQTQTITPLGGVTTTISPDQALTAGAGAGISQAGQTLSQYYMGMLTQISPTIEASAGRHVTFIFTKGVELKLPINNQDSDENIPLPISGN